MKKAKATKDFLRMSDAVLETFAGTVISSMTGNNYFPSPAPALAEVNTVLQSYSISLKGAQTRDVNKVELKKQLKIQLRNMLSQLADYVTHVANGDRVILTSSGFNITQENSAVAELGETKNFKVKPGKGSGEVVMSVKKVKNARFYLFFYAVAGENPVWQFDYDTIPGCSIAGLDPLKTYLFKIRAVGSKRRSVDTEIITKGIA